MKLIEIQSGWATTYYPAHQIVKLTRFKSDGHWVLRFMSEPTSYELTNEVGESLKEWLLTNDKLYPLFEIILDPKYTPASTKR